MIHSNLTSTMRITITDAAVFGVKELDVSTVSVVSKSNSYVRLNFTDTSGLTADMMYLVSVGMRIDT